METPNLYAGEPGFFDDDEVEVLDRLAQDVAHAVEVRDAEALRQLTARDLRMREAQYQALFENSLDAVLSTAPDGRIFAANPSACRLFGRTEDEIRSVGRRGPNYGRS